MQWEYLTSDDFTSTVHSTSVCILAMVGRFWHNASVVQPGD